MKRLKYLIFFLMAVMLLLLKFPHISSPANDASFRFTFVCPLTWENLASGIKAADQTFRTDTKLVGCSRLDPALQVAALETAIYSNPDGIITAGIEDSPELRAVLLKAKERQIPVVLVDSDLPDSGRLCYIGTDNIAAGHLAGQEIRAVTGGDAAIGIIASSLEASNQAERLLGFSDEIRLSPGMSIVSVAECESSRLLLNEKVPQMLRAHPEINALFCMEGYSSDMTGAILKQLGGAYSEIPVVSFDIVQPTFQYIEEGIYYCAIAQSPYTQGYLAVSALVDYLNGNEVNEILYTDVVSIKKENLKEEVSVQYETHNWHMD